MTKAWVVLLVLVVLGRLMAVQVSASPDSVQERLRPMVVSPAASEVEVPDSSSRSILLVEAPETLATSPAEAPDLVMFKVSPASRVKLASPPVTVKSPSDKV